VCVCVCVVGIGCDKLLYGMCVLVWCGVCCCFVCCVTQLLVVVEEKSSVRCLGGGEEEIVLLFDRKRDLCVSERERKKSRESVWECSLFVKSN